MSSDTTSREQNAKAATSGVVFVKRPFQFSESVRKRLGATGQQMAAYVGVTYRTYQRRAKKGMLEDAESAKVEMLDTLLGLGGRVLGSEDEARQWLTSPILSLDSERPIDLLDTVKGYERVRNKLIQIEYGTF